MYEVYRKYVQTISEEDIYRYIRRKRISKKSIKAFDRNWYAKNQVCALVKSGDPNMKMKYPIYVLFDWHGDAHYSPKPYANYFIDPNECVRRNGCVVIDYTYSLTYKFITEVEKYRIRSGFTMNQISDIVSFSEQLIETIGYKMVYTLFLLKQLCLTDTHIDLFYTMGVMMMYGNINSLERRYKHKEEEEIKSIMQNKKWYLWEYHFIDYDITTRKYMIHLKCDRGHWFHLSVKNLDAIDIVFNKCKCKYC